MKPLIDAPEQSGEEVTHMRNTDCGNEDDNMGDEERPEGGDPSDNEEQEVDDADKEPQPEPSEGKANF